MQLRQMQALFSWSAGTWARRSWLNDTDMHQHSTLVLPAAEAAQSLGLPQMGQSGAFGVGEGDRTNFDSAA
jgi:hypothetical protein